MVEVGPKTVQSRTEMAPGKLKLVTSWHQDCMKADISQTCIKPTNSLGKTMILYIPHAQFASKMAQVRTKIRSKSDPSRSKSDPWRLVGPSWRQDGFMRAQRGAMMALPCAQVAVRWSNLELKTAKIGSMCRLVRPSWPQDGRSWAQDGPK